MGEFPSPRFPKLKGGHRDLHSGRQDRGANFYGGVGGERNCSV